MADINRTVIARIKACNKSYSKQDQKAELLKRNQVFLSDLKELEKNIRDKCHGLDIKTITRPGAFRKHPKLRKEPIHPFRYFDKEFRAFCSRWGLYLDWDGSLDNLSRSLLVSPTLEFDHLAAPAPEIDYTKATFPRQNTFNFLYIRVDAWTNLSDIRELWPKIESLQKKIFDYKPEKKADTFGRDLAWYDLHIEFGLTHGQIAKTWVKHCPVGVDLLAIKTFKRKYADALREKLKGRSSALKDHPRLLEMIMKSELGNDLRAAYLEEKAIYITGQFESGRRFTPRLHDAIKQGINRIEKYIELSVPKDPWAKLGTWFKEANITSPRIIDVPWLAELAKIDAAKGMKSKGE